MRWWSMSWLTSATKTTGLAEGTLPDYRQRIGLLKLPPSKS